MSYNPSRLMFCAQRGAKYKPDYGTIDAACIVDAPSMDRQEAGPTLRRFHRRGEAAGVEWATRRGAGFKETSGPDIKSEPPSLEEYFDMSRSASCFRHYNIICTTESI